MAITYVIRLVGSDAQMHWTYLLEFIKHWATVKLRLSTEQPYRESMFVSVGIFITMFGGDTKYVVVIPEVLNHSVVTTRALA